MQPATSHEVTVERREHVTAHTSYVPRCACGWEGMDYSSQHSAWEMADRHIGRAPSIRPDMNRSALSV